MIVVMDWTDALPKADKVAWEFWTNSNDQCGAVCDVQKEFIKVQWSALLCLFAPVLGHMYALRLMVHFCREA